MFFFRCTGEKQTSCWLTHFHPEVIFKFHKKSLQLYVYMYIRKDITTFKAIYYCWLTHFHPEMIFKFYKKSANEAQILFVKSICKNCKNLNTETSSSASLEHGQDQDLPTAKRTLKCNLMLIHKAKNIVRQK